MPRLKVLSLNTYIEAWPQGIFSQRRPKGFYLDMRDNILLKYRR